MQRVDIGHECQANSAVPSADRPVEPGSTLSQSLYQEIRRLSNDRSSKHKTKLPAIVLVPPICIVDINHTHTIGTLYHIPSSEAKQKLKKLGSESLMAGLCRALNDFLVSKNSQSFF